MCGITGIFGMADRKLALRMASLIKYRGPDSEGVYVDGKVSLGFRRLSIIDLSTGDQPIFNETEDMAIIYNGELYNYVQLRKELQAKGHVFKTKSDTETILHAYEEYGFGALEKLNGMFAFAIYDKKKKQLVLARDSVGIKPLYYATVGDNLVFGSEIKCILEHPGYRREVDRQALSSYLTFGTVLGDKTLFSGIKKLPPSHALFYDGKKLEIRKFEPEKTPVPGDLYEVMKNSVQSQLMSDVPLGAFLSGGIDSSTVVGLMSKLSDNPVETFTVGFGEKSDELAYAKIVSDHFGTSHHEIIIEPGSVSKTLEELLPHYDDLTWDSASLPVYLVSKLARKHVKVVLSGEGSDELFAGYERYKPFSQSLPLPNAARYFIYEKFVRFFPNSLRKRIMGIESSYADGILESYKRRKGSALENVMKFEFNEFLPNQLLNKVDKATMAASLEARVPFLDNSVIQFASTLPLSEKLKGFEGKRILRKSMGELLPEITKKRAKKGFGASPIFWFNNPEFRDYATAHLDKPQVKELGLDYSVCRELAEFKGFRKSRKAYQLWALLLLELWYQKFMVQ